MQCIGQNGIQSWVMKILLLKIYTTSMIFEIFQKDGIFKGMLPADFFAQIFIRKWYFMTLPPLDRPFLLDIRLDDLS